MFIIYTFLDYVINEIDYLRISVYYGRILYFLFNCILRFSVDFFNGNLNVYTIGILRSSVYIPISVRLYFSDGLSIFESTYILAI